LSAPRLEISEFEVSLAPATSLRDRAKGGGRNFSGVMGMVGTFCLHAVILQSLGLGFYANNQRSHESRGTFANQTDSRMPPAEELVLIVLQEAAPHRPDLDQQIGSVAPKLKPAPIAILSPDTLPVSDFGGERDVPERSTSPEPVDPALRAMMLSRYLHQISARVERIWTQLDRSTSGSGFKCRVQIRQDTSGIVQEVLLVECPAKEESRQSLIAAIFQASPLNAPPIPSVFSRALTMTFETQPTEAKAPD
jgi:hypothetical protein